MKKSNRSRSRSRFPRPAPETTVARTVEPTRSSRAGGAILRQKPIADANPNLNKYENHHSLSQSQRPSRLAPSCGRTDQTTVQLDGNKFRRRSSRTSNGSQAGVPRTHPTGSSRTSHARRGYTPYASRGVAAPWTGPSCRGPRQYVGSRAAQSHRRPQASAPVAPAPTLGAGQKPIAAQRRFLSVDQHSGRQEGNRPINLKL